MSDIPEFLVRKVECAIKEATNPQGMGVHDGMARIEASLLARLLQHAQLAAPVAPEGYRLVPIEPTQHMRTAGNDELDRLKIEAGMSIADKAFYVYHAMLAAAPQGEGK